mmetsp:Transcript_1540/g.5654  ORF Transcript_1540/g.5654 Transcript_1540/m.5654 type:complete len:1159 (+) Transcript_1540:38-3514(+)
MDLGRAVRPRARYLKRTGTVVTEAAESYVRADVPCGLPACAECAAPTATEPIPGDAALLFLPDAAALERYLEPLELTRGLREVGAAMVLCLSAARAVHDRGNHRLSVRVRALYKEGPTRAAFLFSDEHSHAVRALASAGVPPLLATAGWYASKPTAPPEVVVVSDHLAAEEGLGVRVPEGVVVLSGPAFFARYAAPEAAALAATLHEAATTTASPSSLPPGESASGGGINSAVHLTPEQMRAGMLSGELIEGILEVSRHRPEEAVVRPAAGGAGALALAAEGESGGGKGRTKGLGEVLVPSRDERSRAVHGDRVVVRLLPRAQWKARGGDLVWDEAALPEEEEAEEEEKEDSNSSSASSTKSTRRVSPAVVAEPTGAVMGILQRSLQECVCCLALEEEEELREYGDGKRQSALAIPMDRRLPKIRLRTRQPSSFIGQRFLVRFDGWDAGTRHPDGHVVRVLGALGDIAAELAALLAENRVLDEPFGPGALAELPKEGTAWTVPADELARRRDCRSLRACSIDPPGCTDVDDVLSVRFLDDGTGRAEIGVHIADVSHFVALNSRLDLEARERGTTVYLVDRRLDMLPALLSERLCSLVAGVERLAVSVLWTLDASTLEVIDTWAGRTVIRSRHQLHYAQAQAMLDGKPPPDASPDALPPKEQRLLKRDLELLDRFAAHRRAQRQRDGSLELASAELRFETSADGLPISLQEKQELPVNALVAELMIAANSTVASRVRTAFPASALVRRHPPPKLADFEELQELCTARGFALDASSADAVAASLAALARHVEEPAVGTLFKAMATRAMSEAQYCSTGESPQDGTGFRHFGLALEDYTHFTSPIRRYADVIVHRQLLAALELEAQQQQSPPPMPHGTLAPVARSLNERNRASKAVQKRCSELYLLKLLQIAPRVEEAVVHAVRPNGLLLFLPRFHVKGAVKLADGDGDGNITLPDEGGAPPPQTEGLRLVHDNDAQRLAVVGASGREHCAFALLQRVHVELSSVPSRSRGPTLRMRLLAPGHPEVKRAVSADAEAADEPGNGPHHSEQSDADPTELSGATPSGVPPRELHFLAPAAPAAVARDVAARTRVALLPATEHALEAWWAAERAAARATLRAERRASCAAELRERADRAEARAKNAAHELERQRCLAAARAAHNPS